MQLIESGAAHYILSFKIIIPYLPVSTLVQPILWLLLLIISKPKHMDCDML